VKLAFTAREALRWWFAPACGRTFERAMLRSRIALFALVTVAAASGCEARVKGDAGVGSTSSALGVGTGWPPHVDVPVGASREEICGRSDGDMKAAFREHAKGHTGPDEGAFIPQHVPGPEQYQYTCRYCDLDGARIEAPIGFEFFIEDSTMANAIVPDGTVLHLKNTYARGLRIAGTHTTISSANADLRCAQGQGPGVRLTFGNFADTRVDDLDAAGIGGMDVAFRGDVKNLRMTGAAVSSADFRITTLDGARLDHVSSSSGIVFEPDCIPGPEGDNCRKYTDTKYSGAIAFDGTPQLAVRFDHVTLRWATVSTSSSHGSVILAGRNVLDNVAFETGSGDVRLTGDLSALQLLGKTIWPVGAHGLVTDAALPTIALGGAILTPAKGEAWPPPGTVLDGLRLSHGGFADGVDLSRASLKGAKLERVRFSDVTLSRAEGGVQKGASFEGASVAQAHFDQAELDGVSFHGADVRGASFALARGSADFSAAKAGRLPPHTDDNDTDRPVDTSFKSARLGTSHFEDAVLQYAIFRNAGLADVAFDRAAADWADFTSARFFRRAADGAGISNGSLARAGSLHGALFDGADLRGVSLAGVDLSPATAQATSFVGTFLCGADLSGAKLRGANLSGALFDVTGNVQFPGGSVGPCAGGKRAGADTSSIEGTKTACPLRGEEPNGPAGQCSDAQWKLEGTAGCSPDQTKTARRNGAPCTTKCDCQSAFCNAQKVCADGP
jgi:uncharacterized protein YjbI with pentapeptide repeats